MIKWWTGDIEVVEVEGRMIALDGWTEKHISIAGKWKKSNLTQHTE